MLHLQQRPEFFNFIDTGSGTNQVKKKELRLKMVEIQGTGGIQDADNSN